MALRGSAWNHRPALNPAPSPGWDVPLEAKGPFWHPIHLGSLDVPEPMQALAGSKP